MNWARFNVPQIITTVITVGGVGVAVVMYSSGTRGMAELNTYRLDQQERTIQLIQAQLSALTPLGFQVPATQATVDANNKRVDRMVDNFTTQMSEMQKSINTLTTQVQVLSNQIQEMGKGKSPSYSGGN